MSRRLLLLACLLFPPHLIAQETLAWKLDKGDVVFIERQYLQTSQVTTTTKVLKQESESTWVTRCEVLEPKSGRIVVRANVESVVQTVKGGPAKVENKWIEKMKGTGFTLELSPAGVVHEMLGYEAFLGDVAGKDADSRRVVQAMFPEPGFKEGFAEVFSFLPARSVTVGATWERKAFDAMPPFGKLELATKYTFQGEREGMSIIKGAIAGKFVMPQRPDELFRVVEGNVQAERGEWTYRFDAAKGRLASAEKSMLLKGSITIEIDGKRLPHGLHSENTLKVSMYTK
jgi:hypothetical protein